MKERTPMDIAMNLLARRGFSCRELKTRLTKAGMTPDLAGQVLSECQRLGLVNDEIYARDCAEMLAARGLGTRRIRQELRLRGVAEQAGSAVEDLAGNEAERAMEAARYKLRLISPQDPPLKKRQKLYRFLLNRGFSGDVVSDTVHAVLAGIPAEE